MPNRPTTFRPPGYQTAKSLYDEHRESATQRGYDATWQKVRLSKLRMNPLCEICEKDGRLTPAVLAHHVIPIEERPDLRLELANLQALCRPCHERIHGRLPGEPRSKGIAFRRSRLRPIGHRLNLGQPVRSGGHPGRGMGVESLDPLFPRPLSPCRARSWKIS